jgi:hypothetical protein
MPPSSPEAAAVFEAADELVVIALNVTQGFDGTAATGVGDAVTGAAGAAALATVGTAQSETAIAAAVNLRAKPNIKLIPLEKATVSPFRLQFPPLGPNTAVEFVATHLIWTVFDRVWPKGRYAASASRWPLRFL